MKQKVVIIGSGLGGLSTGLILAKNGYEVTILEQCAVPGGCLQCFYRDGAKFETGMHFVGSLAEGQTLNRLFKYLELDDVELSSLDPTGYDVVSLGGKQYRFATGREAFIDTLAQDFPDQRENLERYYDLICRISEASSLNSLRNAETDLTVSTQYQLRSINEVIDSLITDPLLRKVLVGNLPLYAAEYDKTPFITHAFISGSYNQSAYRIVGGSDRIAHALISALRRHGATLLTRKKVTSILCDNDRATGVLTEDGTTYPADFVISGIHPTRTIEMVESRLIRPVYRKRLMTLPNTSGVFTVYLKFKPGAMPYMNHNHYGYPAGTPWNCEKYTDADWPKAYLYMHMCHEPHPTHAQSAVILAYMNMQELQRWVETTVGKRGADYEAFKARKAEKLIQTVAQDFPNLPDAIESVYTSTPLSYRDYTGTIDGSIYGIAKDVNAANETRVAHRTRIPNLFYTGQNINSHGMLGVLVGSIVTCSEFLTAEKIYQQIKKAEMKRNVLIIGGGLGGLFTGAILAKEGLQVKILEKNPIIGGGLQTFKRHGISFETGMHILGGLRRDGSVHKICEYLGIMDKLSIRDVDPDCADELHLLCDGMTYHIRQGREGFIDSLAEYFPAERDNLRAYIDHLYRIADEVDFFYLRKGSDALTSHSDDFFIAADELIANHIEDPKLRCLLGYMNPMYAGLAGHTPAYIHALINVLYIQGASRFVGNSQQMAEALREVIESNGGSVIPNTAVTRVDVQDKQVTAVHDNQGNTHTADLYISSIHPCTLLDLMPDDAMSKAYAKRLRSIPNTYSAFSVFIKLKPDSFPYINHTCYCLEGYDNIWNMGEPCQNWPRGFMYMTPPEANQGPYAQRIVINCSMSFDEVRQWQDTKVGHRGPEYLQWKQSKIDLVLDKLCRIYPNLRDQIEHIEAASPLTIRDFYGTKEGSLYGFRKDCKNIMLSQVPSATKVKNLLLTGQNINLHGICGVPLNSVGTAEIILGRNYIVHKINQNYSDKYGNH